jgi:predicted Rossmann-fold nucleotide-binding protein
VSKRVLVCGGRNYADRETVYAELAKLDPDVVIEGGALGADKLAFDWARLNGRGSVTHEADWAKLGAKAGPIRNAEMLRLSEPDMVLAFPGGRGTADMVRRAEKAGIRVVRVAARTPDAGRGSK